MSEIEYFGEVGPTAPLTITDIAYNEGTDRITLTWNSKPGRSYTVFATTDLSVFDSDVNDAVLSGGDVTVFEFANINPGTVRQYFKVVEN